MSAGETMALGFSALGCMALLAVVGMRVLRLLTLALEGHYEFHGDSLTRRSRLGGFFRFILWAVAAAVTWSFFIDWFWFEDFDFAVGALLLRLEVVLHILAELGDD